MFKELFTETPKKAPGGPRRPSKRPPSRPSSKDTIQRNGNTYTIDTIMTSKGSGRESPYYSLILKPVKNKELDIITYKDVFWYTRGYDQYQNSGEQWYLYTLDFGGAGNGGGQKSASKPGLYGHTQTYVYNIASGKEKSKDWDDAEYTFSNGTKMARIKSELG